MDLMTNRFRKLGIRASHNSIAGESLLLPMEALREQLAFLPLDDRERLAPLNGAFARILIPGVNMHREKLQLLDNGDALVTEHRRRLGNDGPYYNERFLEEGVTCRLMVTLGNLRKRYQDLVERVGQVRPESPAVLALRRQITALERRVKAMYLNACQQHFMGEYKRLHHCVGVFAEKAKLESLQSELSMMKAEELRKRANYALEKYYPGRRDESDSTKAYDRLCEARKLCSQMADCHQNLCANLLRKRGIYIEKLESVKRLARLEAKLREIQQTARP